MDVWLIMFVTAGAFVGTMGALLVWSKVDARASVRSEAQETANAALARLEKAVERVEAAAGVVAQDLAAAHERADEAAADDTSEAGEGADAAARSPKDDPSEDPDIVTRPDGTTYRGMGK